LTAVPVSSPTQLAAPGPVDGTISQTRYILPNIADIQGNPAQTEIEKAIKSRLIDTLADGTFQPNAIVTRGDFARTLLINTPLRQTVGASAKFTDVSGDFKFIAEALTAKGSTLRDFDFTPNALISSSGTIFNPTGTVSRLDMAVAFVRALGHDTEARALANSNVTFNNQVLSDNAQIPASLRGYVQIAINNGLFEAYPAEVRNLGNGQFQALPGPRFEPTGTMNRATLATKLNSFHQLFTTGN
jgi:serine protease AprX